MVGVRWQDEAVAGTSAILQAQGREATSCRRCRGAAVGLSIKRSVTAKQRQATKECSRGVEVAVLTGPCSRIQEAGAEVLE